MANDLCGCRMSSVFVMSMKKLLPFYGLVIVPLIFALVTQIGELVFLLVVASSFFVGLSVGGLFGYLFWRYRIMSNNRRTSSFLGFILFGVLSNFVTTTIFVFYNPAYIPNLIVFRDFDLILVFMMLIIWYFWYDRSFQLLSEEDHTAELM